MNITRSERVIGFMLAASGGLHPHAPALETLDGLAILRKCIINGNLEPTPSMDPPPGFIFEAPCVEYFDYPTLVAARVPSRISPVLLCLPLSLLPQKQYIGLNIAAVSTNKLEGMACATICFAMHFGVHVDNSLFIISTLLNTVIRLVLSQSDSGPHSGYQLACHRRLDVIEFDGSTLSIMSTCLWSLRELNRRIVRWEIDTNREQLPDLARFCREILAEISTKTGDPVYTYCVDILLACYVGQRHLSRTIDMNATTSQRTRRFLQAYLTCIN